MLASAIVIPALAQQGQPTTDTQNTPTAKVEQQPSPNAPPSFTINAPKEGFWGRVNPFARKKWVNNRVDPLKGQLSELDEVNAKNARDIKDVDGRAQTGIRRAQSTADQAKQTASEAGSLAQRANATALGANGHVDQLNTTISGLDQYRQVNQLEVAFHGSQPILSVAARKQLDAFAANLAGHQGYVLEIEGHSPQASTAGIQNSGRLAEAVKRYLVTEDQIPVYRLHTVALGNAPSGSEETKPAKTSSVSIRLMENSLAAREVAPPHDAASSTGEERP
ncbi:MAG: flagellar motor protein MotB [Terracidiphilus sp.]